MTLRQMMSRYPDAFYRQSWYAREAFIHRHARTDLTWPADVSPFVPEEDPAYTAADLAKLWLEDPRNGLWTRYLWTADTDAWGQRVYVGTNGLGLEIHRHLHLTERWGVPV